MIQITREPIDSSAVLAAVSDPDCGANLLFLGTTRRWTGDVETLELNYECYEGMAEKELQKLCEEARQRWDLRGLCVVHRIGKVPVGQASVAVGVSSPHRADGFAAAEWLIDTLKQVVPIWKQEVSRSGDTSWVHPDSGVKP
ncbi:MAG: molybdenum cofactor biosynthesis protein MoaE [Pirellulaceae bacterium]